MLVCVGVWVSGGNQVFVGFLLAMVIGKALTNTEPTPS
jgi:hypothetical protein